MSCTANITGQSVQAPYTTYSDSGPPSSVFAQSQSGTEFAITDVGTGMYDNEDGYSAIYQPSSVGSQATIQTEVVTPYALSGYNGSVVTWVKAVASRGLVGGSKGAALGANRAPAGRVPRFRPAATATVPSMRPGSARGGATAVARGAANVPSRAQSRDVNGT